MQIDVPEGYESLAIVLELAMKQAAFGKGLERHACGEPFEQQKICRIAKAVGVGFALGQAEKKIEEAIRLDAASGMQELLGAINYTAAAYLVMCGASLDGPGVAPLEGGCVPEKDGHRPWRVHQETLCGKTVG